MRHTYLGMLSFPQRHARNLTLSASGNPFYDASTSPLLTFTGTPVTQPIDHTTVPLIDISGLRSGELSQRQAVARELRKACENSGFFYIKNHGIAPVLIEQVLAETASFFDQPEEKKLAVSKSKSKCNRGYEPLRAQTLEAGAPPDLKESFYLGIDLPEDHPSVKAGKFNHGPNQWPEDLPDFRRVTTAYFGALYELGGIMMRGLALSLDLPENHFDDFLDDATANLRLLHYPPQPVIAQPDEKGCGAHTDFGALTFLLQDDSGGLQVQPANTGKWSDAPPIAGTYVVNIGDLIERWTNGRYKSTLHRVINRSGHERHSVPFFFTGNYATVVECIPTCLKEGEEPKHAPITVEQHLMDCYKRTYG